jgi:CheY-like chemotaxis protein
VIDDDESQKVITCTSSAPARVRGGGRPGRHSPVLRPGADVIVTDIFMPEQDGLETIRELRRESPRVKIVAISGGDSTGRLDLRKEAEIFGASRTLPKPFDPAELLKVVHELLGEATGGA